MPKLENMQELTNYWENKGYGISKFDHKLYIFILEKKKSLKCVGWGNEYEFKSKFWNYLVYDCNNSYSDKTTTLILAKDESVEMI